ncbi:MAG: hypothetical protein ACK6A9_03485 [Dolichospermum sp.]
MLKKLSVRGGNREQGTGNREQGIVLTVWISSIFQIQQRKMHLF